MLSCPCKECTTRYVGCHSTCIRYNTWSANRSAAMQQLRNDRMLLGEEQRRLYGVNGIVGEGMQHKKVRKQ